jgi:hypothetical protein
MNDRVLLWTVAIAALTLSVVGLVGPSAGRYRLYKSGQDSQGNERHLVFDTATGEYRVESVVGVGPAFGDVYIVSPFRRDFGIQHMGSSKASYSDGKKPD